MSKAQELKDLIKSLTDKLIDITDPEEHKVESKKLQQAYDDLRNEKVTREDDLGKIIGFINDKGYTLAELTRYAKVTLHKDFLKKVQGKKPAQAASAPKTAKVFASDSNPVFILIPRAESDHQKVTDVSIHVGRTNEFYSGKSIFASTLPIPLARLKYGADGTTVHTLPKIESALAKFVVADQVEYAKTPEGKAEIKKIAEAVSKFEKKAKS